MNAICLVVDRLHAGYLGAYGNTWIETPFIDELAAQSFVLDQMLVDTPRLDALYRSYWHGWHALAPQPPYGRPTLAAMLHGAGVTTALVTDDRTISEHPLAADFDEIIAIEPPRTAEVVEFPQTHMAQCSRRIMDWLKSARRPFLLWCHLGGLGTKWDADIDFMPAACEGDDPLLPAAAEVPNRMLADSDDPEEVFKTSQLYAGQVAVLDTCVAGLTEFLRDGGLADDTLLALTSARGFPLGEHGRIGPCDEAIYSELVHVPLMMRFPGGLGAAARSQALVEPADLWATLLDFWRIADRPRSPSGASLMPLVRNEVAMLRDRLLVGRADQRAIRTPAWFLRRAAERELFFKPDDFWEVNNVAQRCQEVVECLEDAMSQFEQTLQAGQISDLPALSEVLVKGLE